MPGALALTLPLAKRLRYGTNPQERAAFYLDRRERLPEQLHGKSLSYNNLLDLDATLRLLSRAPLGADFGDRGPLVRAVAVKHTVPCGAAERPTGAAALRDALAADAISVYGGIVAVDASVDREGAEVLSSYFLEIVAAPAFDDDALALLRKKKNVRVMRFAASLPDELARELRVRSALGGVLAEDDDPGRCRRTLASREPPAPTPREWNDLGFAWDVVRHVKSNGIVVVKDRVTRGICAGQTNRVSAVQIAAKRAGVTEAACASDGFFPFADGLEAAAEGGCTAVIAPAGSVRDAEVVAAADRLDSSARLLLAPLLLALTTPLCILSGAHFRCHPERSGRSTCSRKDEGRSTPARSRAGPRRAASMRRSARRNDIAKRAKGTLVCVDGAWVGRPTLEVGGTETRGNRGEGAGRRREIEAVVGRRVGACSRSRRGAAD